MKDRTVKIMDKESRKFIKFMAGSSLVILLTLTVLNLAVFGQAKVSMLSHENEAYKFSKEFEGGEAQISMENFIENQDGEFRYARVGILLRASGEVYIVGLIDYDLTFYIDGEQVLSQTKPIYGHIYQEAIDQVTVGEGEQLSVKGTVNAYFMIDGDIEQVQFVVDMEYDMSFAPIYGEVPIVVLITLGEVLLFLTSASLLYLGQKWEQKNPKWTRNFAKRVLARELIVGFP